MRGARCSVYVGTKRSCRYGYCVGERSTIGCLSTNLLDYQASGGQRTKQFGLRPGEVDPRQPVRAIKDDHLPVVAAEQRNDPDRRPVQQSRPDRQPVQGHPVSVRDGQCRRELTKPAERAVQRDVDLRLHRSNAAAGRRVRRQQRSLSARGPRAVCRRMWISFRQASWPKS